MKKSVLLPVAAAALLIAQAAQAQNSDSRFPLFDNVAAAQHHCPFDVVVWLNIKSDTYKIGGPQAGDTKENGAYMCQRDADQMDYLPAMDAK